jgi:hypothetical protein
LENTCWKCGETTTCIVAVHPEGSRQSDDLAWFEDKHAFRFIRELLVQGSRSQLAATIKDRFSRTAGGSYLSNGCQHCDAIQGDWPLGHAISDYVVGAPLGELEVLATVIVTQAAWSDVLAGQGMHRYGYPMTWEDMD